MVHSSAYSGFEKEVVDSIKDELKDKLQEKLGEILVPTHQVTEVKKEREQEKIFSWLCFS